MSEDKVQFDKLKGEENWPTWKITIKTLLECDGVYDVIDSSYVQPKDGDANYQKELDKYNKANLAAKKRLILSLDTKPLLRVGGCKTAKDVWDKLCQIYDYQSEENVDLLRHKFHNIQWDNSGGMQCHLAKFDDVQTKMMLLNKPLDEGDMCARLLQTLPKEYDHIYVTWHDLPVSEKTWSKLQKRCLNFELRLDGREESDNSCEMTAMMSKLKTSSGKYSKNKSNPKNKNTSWSKPTDIMKSKSNFKNKRCFTCGKIGHLSKECYIGVVCFKCIKKGHRATECLSGEQMQDYAMMMKTEKPIDLDLEMLKCDIWYVDSGATHHITNKFEWYASYTPFKTPKKMDSARQGVQIEVLGSGRIYVKCFDRNKWHERYFDDVWYCPEATCNLFSVKRAGEKGIDQSIQNNGRDWIFTKHGNAIAIAVSINSNELYRMAVKVVYPEKSLTISENIDSLQTWHEQMSPKQTACSIFFENSWN